MQNETNKIVLFTDGTVTLDVAISPEKDTVWLNRQQMALLFDRDIKTIGKHINNAIEEELNDFPTIANFATVQKKTAVVANFATTAADGKKYMTSYYNLDVIISVGYRVKSKRGIAFHKWNQNNSRSNVSSNYHNDCRI